ncbi:MAG: YicC family protein [Rikenellaceae bacterium]|nr:YicC family protein [Rikenellaceae bacterium]MBP3290200.1 YicC family protein [Alistipes sp.]MBQ8545227.1 YicC family protein [Alistipes sp.]MBR3703486.1 YicC family protein [Alistipes sp.]
MTGFGKGEAVLPNKKITVEVRSLNSKQLDLSVRMPGIFRQKEFELRSVAGAAIQRGKADITVTVENTTVSTSATVNKEIFKEYMRQVNEALSYAGTSADYDAIVPAVLRMPEVVSTQAESLSEEESEALMQALEQALQQFNAFREQEGATLIADLLRRVDLIEEYKCQVEPYEATRAETIKNRIRENLAQLKVDIDTNRLEQEMIFYIEKLDITEEKVRLKNHCNYFREVAASEEAVGRKLGFIAQEMGREINTLGSKSNEANMQILVVKMKDELEKIKEQVLNIL